MGPRFFKRGEIDPDVHGVHIGRASMGPRFFKRGEDDRLRRRRRILVDASMGPRFFKRGEAALAVM